VSYRVRTVDVFTARPLAGNQLAVVLDADGLDPGKMQDLAREMNISETTYVLAPADPAHAARVRIFTPTAELAFAGHPTIGTAWVIRDEGLIPAGAESLVLEEGIGPVPVRVDAQAEPAVLWMTHPEVSEQGTRMGRQSFLKIRLAYSSADLPSLIEVGGSVRPVLSGELADGILD